MLVGSKNKSSDKRITLSKFIENLRSDLIESAKARPPGWKPIFKIAEALVEVQIRVEKGESEKAGFDIYVLSVGSNSIAQNEILHKVSIRLIPIEDENYQKGLSRLGALPRCL